MAKSRENADWPSKIGKWTVIEQLASRLDKVVFLAEKDNKLAAIKFLKNADLLDEKDFERFALEIQNLQVLDHPNIPKVIDFDLTDAMRPWLATEYIESKSIQELVDQGGPLPPDLWWKSLNEIVETLTYIHSKGIYHRDISPSNVLISSDSAKLIDFGLSYMKFNPNLTPVNVEVFGTQGTLSPESLNFIKDPKMDLFSLGSTFVFAGTKVFPFETTSERDNWISRISYEAPNFEGLLPEARKILTPLLYKAPDDRPTAEIYLSILSNYDSFFEIDSKSNKQLESFLKNSEDKLRNLGQGFARNAATKKASKSLKLAIGTLALALFGVTFWAFSSQFPLQENSEISSQVVDTNIEANSGVVDPQNVEESFGTSNSKGSGGAKAKSSKSGSTEAQCDDLSLEDNVESKVLEFCGAEIQAGNLLGYYRIGFYYYEQKQQKEAIYWWKQGAEKKSAISMYRLAGVLFENGETAQAKTWYRACIDASETDGGKSWCANGLGKIYYLEKNVQESRYWYQMSADLGDEEGLYRVGLNYAGDEKWQKALDNLLKIPKPNLATKSLIGSLYMEIGKDNLALRWLQEAAEAGSADAMVNLGVIAYRSKDFESAIKVWKQASSLGQGSASYKLARLYEELNEDESSLEYDKIGASQGEVGSIFFYGFKLEKSGQIEKARNWYQKGADLNDPTNMVQLGALIFEVDQNRSGACELWRRAADLGNDKAKENLANLCSADKSSANARPSTSPSPSTSFNNRDPNVVPKAESSSTYMGFSNSEPISSDLESWSIFGRAYLLDGVWRIPLTNFSDEQVPPINRVQFRDSKEAPFGTWANIAYKIVKNETLGSYSVHVDNLVIQLLYNRNLGTSVCPEFRFARVENGQVRYIWNKTVEPCQP